jgi:uncharacterized protein YodC (DUF2158 family)
MSKRRMKRKHKPPVPAKFKIGDRVRVKPGMSDEDHPDLPLGGWAGTISEVHKRGMYSVRWSRDTLASIHPIYKRRCAIDGKVLEEYWLEEEDLEIDPGGPLSIEQPTKITPRPLLAKNQDDRVRMVFGLTSDDFLPAVDGDSLETYYDHLVEHMSLPAQARYWPQEDFLDPLSRRRIEVIALDGEIAWDEEDGILCKIRTSEAEEIVPLMGIEFRRSDPNHRLVDDFSAWFCGELPVETEDNEDDEWDEDAEEDDQDEDDSEVLENATWRNVALLFLEIFAFAVCYGAVVGAAVAAMPWARWAAYIGGGVWGLLVMAAKVHFARKDMTHIAPRFKRGLGGTVGLVAGALQGAFFGIMAVACIGALLGGIVGILLRRVFAGKQGRFFHVFPGSVLFAAACGVAAQAFYVDRIAASEGLWDGAWAGLGIALLFCLSAVPLAVLTVRSPSRRD